MDKKPSVSRAEVKAFLEGMAGSFERGIKDAVTSQGKLEHLYPEREADIAKQEELANSLARRLEFTRGALYYIDHYESEDQLF